MQNLLKKTFFVLLPFGLLLTTAQGANFNELFNVGVINSNSSAKQHVVIYNHDQTKCLSTYGHHRKATNILSYATCRVDSYDTWEVTRSGKIKNERSGKCLSSPQGQDTLVLAHCNTLSNRGYMAYDFVILNNLQHNKDVAVEVAKLH